ncbi:hypothetical protein MCUN1_003278 [Malassezia cuniculi]|uniref:Uncharacterized protein n=1 Tax=Malassezia cuniculi TaxID=948313 RepID=A0AAF0EWE6_9BASI|nr:hypothetical protein MCUN1_003278 [Malassezia cuniculi]
MRVTSAARHVHAHRKRTSSARSKSDSLQEEIRRLTTRVTSLQDRIRSVDERIGPPASQDPALERLAADRAKRDLVPLESALVWLDLYADVKRFLDASAQLLFVYERVPQNHRRAPNIADVLSRIWATGVEFPLSRMDAVKATTRDEAFTLDDVCFGTLYYTYSLFSSILEGTNSRAVRRSCIEWLGSIAAHLSLMLHHTLVGNGQRLTTPRGATLHSDVLDMFECSSWRTAALHWRGQSIRESPQHGILYSAIASIDCEHPLNMLYWYCKSVQVARPHLGARAAAVDLAVRSSHAETPEDLFMYIQGMLLTGNYNVIEACARLARALYDGESLCDTHWMRMALCSIAAVLGYGDTQAFIGVRLLAAHLVPARERRVPDSLKDAIASLDIPPVVDSVSLPDADMAALELLLTLIDAAAAALDGESDIGVPSAAFLTVVFSFVHAVSLRNQGNMIALQSYLRSRIPWRALARVAHSLISCGGSPPKNEELPKLASEELPEDWVLHGTSWAITGPWYFGGADVGHGAVGADTVHSSLWGYIERNEADMFASRDTTNGRRSLGNQPFQAQLQDEAHLRDVRCARLFLIVALSFSQLGQNLGIYRVDTGAGTSVEVDASSAP